MNLHGTRLMTVWKYEIWNHCLLYYCLLLVMTPIVYMAVRNNKKLNSADTFTQQFVVNVTCGTNNRNKSQDLYINIRYLFKCKSNKCL